MSLGRRATWEAPREDFDYRLDDSGGLSDSSDWGVPRNRGEALAVRPRPRTASDVLKASRDRSVRRSEATTDRSMDEASEFAGAKDIFALDSLSSVDGLLDSAMSGDIKAITTNEEPPEESTSDIDPETDFKTRAQLEAEERQEALQRAKELEAANLREETARRAEVFGAKKPQCAEILETEEHQEAIRGAAAALQQRDRFEGGRQTEEKEEEDEEDAYGDDFEEDERFASIGDELREARRQVLGLADASRNGFVARQAFESFLETYPHVVAETQGAKICADWLKGDFVSSLEKDAAANDWYDAAVSASNNVSSRELWEALDKADDAIRSSLSDVHRASRERIERAWRSLAVDDHVVSRDAFLTGLRQSTDCWLNTGELLAGVAPAASTLKTTADDDTSMALDSQMPVLSFSLASQVAPSSRGEPAPLGQPPRGAQQLAQAPKHEFQMETRQNSSEPPPLPTERDELERRRQQLDDLAEQLARQQALLEKQREELLRHPAPQPSESPAPAESQQSSAQTDEELPFSVDDTSYPSYHQEEDPGASVEEVALEAPILEPPAVLVTKTKSAHQTSAPSAAEEYHAPPRPQIIETPVASLHQTPAPSAAEEEPAQIHPQVIEAPVAAVDPAIFDHEMLFARAAGANAHRVVELAAAALARATELISNPSKPPPPQLDDADNSGDDLVGILARQLALQCVVRPRCAPVRLLGSEWRNNEIGLSQPSDATPPLQRLQRVVTEDQDESFCSTDDGSDVMAIHKRGSSRTKNAQVQSEVSSPQKHIRRNKSQGKRLPRWELSSTLETSSSRDRRDRSRQSRPRLQHPRTNRDDFFARNSQSTSVQRKKQQPSDPGWSDDSAFQTQFVDLVSHFSESARTAKVKESDLLMRSAIAETLRERLTDRATLDNIRDSSLLKLARLRSEAH